MNDFEAFYRDNFRLVYALALARTVSQDLMDDLVQETFFRAWRHFDALSAQPPRAQRAWLAQTLRHLFVDHWRRDRLQRDAPAMPAAPSAQPQIVLRLDVARALAGLEETDRTIVLARYFLEMNSREIGEMLDMPEGTVRHRLLHGRRYLAEKLAAWNAQGDRG